MPNDMPPARRRPPGRPESAPAGAPRRRPTAAAQRAVPRRGAKLVCTAGPKTGSEFSLNDEEAVIGRAVDVAISIPDTSVSRRHVLLRRSAAGWLASDLGSGNGTQVNGEPITEEALLRNGDTLTLGDTELTFMEVDDALERRAPPVKRSASRVDVAAGRAGARPPEARPRVARSGEVDPAVQGRKRRMMIFAVLFFPLTGGLFVGLKIKDRQEMQEASARELLAQQRRTQLAAMFQEAKNLVRAGKWDEAKVKFDEIKATEPSYPSIDDYLARAEVEIPNQAALAEAEAALAENRIGPGGAALAKVSADTQLFQRLRALKAQLEEKVVERLADAREAMELAPEVSSAKDVSKYDEVLAITSDILEYQPDNRDAKVLHARAQSARDALTRSYAPPPPPPSRPWESAIDLFTNGDVSGAFSVANACAAQHPRCKSLVSQMNEFQQLYKRVEELDAKELTQLLALDAKITDGRTSKMARKAGTRAATIYYKSASAAKASGQWARALEHARKALEAEPGHGAAQAIVSELRQRAKEIYLLGYSVKETNPEDAIARFKEVVAMTPPDDETHQKARRRLEELAR